MTETKFDIVLASLLASQRELGRISPFSPAKITIELEPEEMIELRDSAPLWVRIMEDGSVQIDGHTVKFAQP